MTYREQQARKQEMLRLYESGMTMDKIGEKFGVSRQRVFQIIGGNTMRHHSAVTPTKCIYIGLRNWLNDNDVSIMGMTRKMYGNSSPANYQHTKCVLNGKNNMRKFDIDKIIKITGLTYEKLFEEERKEQYEMQE